MRYAIKKTKKKKTISSEEMWKEMRELRVTSKYMEIASGQ